MNTAILFTTYAAVGLATTALLIAIGWALTFLAGRRLWQRLIRIYHFTVILYWLERLEKGGWREFQKAEREDKERAAQEGKSND